MEVSVTHVKGKDLRKKLKTIPKVAERWLGSKKIEGNKKKKRKKNSGVAKGANQVVKKLKVEEGEQTGKEDYEGQKCCEKGSSQSKDSES